MRIVHWRLLGGVMIRGASLSSLLGEGYDWGCIFIFSVLGEGYDWGVHLCIFSLLGEGYDLGVHLSIMYGQNITKEVQPSISPFQRNPHGQNRQDADEQPSLPPSDTNPSLPPPHPSVARP